MNAIINALTGHSRSTSGVAAAENGAAWKSRCVRFPGAAGVFLVGAFNNWSTAATPLRPGGDGAWELPWHHGMDEVCWFFVLAPHGCFGRLVRKQHDAAVWRAAGIRELSP